MSALVLRPGAATLNDLERIYFDAKSVQLERACRARVEQAAQLLARAAAGDKPLYGINTGFGKLAQVRIAPEQTVRGLS